jgi:NADPH:quinone reductase-like Zn-dependent oxidoreductase
MPECAADKVVIRNEVVGVAFADVLIRETLYPGVPGWVWLTSSVTFGRSAASQIASASVSSFFWRPV